MINLPNYVVDDKEEKYKRLKDLGSKLKVPIPETFVTMSVYDKNGKLTNEQSQRSHSWVRNAYTQLICQFASVVGVLSTDATYGAGKLNTKNWSGSTQYYTGSGLSYFGSAVGNGWRGTGGAYTHGIVVGTSDLAEDFALYNLDELIVHGVTTDTLSYQAMALPTRTYTAGTKTWDIVWERYINNNSGGTITIKEVGIIANNLINLGTFNLIMRDVLSSPVELVDSAQLKVTYTVSLQYPA